jgi:cytochrome c5
MRDKNRTATVGVLAVALIFMVSVMVITSGPVRAEESTSPVADSAEQVVKDTAESEAAEAGKAEEKVQDAQPVVKGSDKKGKYFYKKTCKSCHAKKGEGGEITPISKTIKQWERYFRKDKHDEKKLSEEFEAKQLIHIKTFLINHAADSDQPETCG